MIKIKGQEIPYIVLFSLSIESVQQYDSFSKHHDANLKGTLLTQNREALGLGRQTVYFVAGLDFKKSGRSSRKNNAEMLDDVMKQCF